MRHEGYLTTPAVTLPSLSGEEVVYVVIEYPQ